MNSERKHKLLDYYLGETEIDKFNFNKDCEDELIMHYLNILGIDKCDDCQLYFRIEIENYKQCYGCWKHICMKCNSFTNSLPDIFQELYPFCCLTCIMQNKNYVLEELSLRSGYFNKDCYDHYNELIDSLK